MKACNYCGPDGFTDNSYIVYSPNSDSPIKVHFQFCPECGRELMACNCYRTVSDIGVCIQKFDKMDVTCSCNGDVCRCELM